MNLSQFITRGLCFAFLFANAGAEPVAGEAKSGDMADFGPAFELLVGLGLNDAKGADYVKFTLQPDSNREEYNNDRGWGGVGTVKRDGNAWVFPDSKEGTHIMIHDQYQRSSVLKKKKRGGIMRLLVGEDKSSNGDGKVGDWEMVDVAKDVQKILKSLDVMQQNGRAFDAERWGYDLRSSQMASKVLVTACHMYRAGHRKEGNQLARKILSLSPDPTNVIDNIVDQIAQKKYQALVNEFERSKDWQAYYDGLTKLTEQFPRGWQAELGARILLSKLEQKIQGGKSEWAVFKGVTLKPEAVGILDALLERKDPIVVATSPYWLIANTSDQAANTNGYRDQQNAEEWIKKLYAMGMDGFVALAAVTADESLMETFISLSYEYSDYEYINGFRSNWGSEQSLDEQALRSYATMRRPCTRGEIARKILISTMPNPDGDLANKSPEELRDVAYQWWLAHRGDSKSELARHFMDVGDRQAQQAAVFTLIASGKNEDAKLIEEYIMSADSLDSTIHLLEPYLKARKGKARQFFETFSTVLKDIEANDSDSMPWNIRGKGKLDEFLKRLSIYVDDVSQEKVLADIRSGKTTIKEGLPMLEATSVSNDSLEQLALFVSLAAERESLLDICQILEYLVAKKQQFYRRGEVVSEEDRGKNIAALSEAKADWGKLLARTSPPQGEEEKNILNGSSSLQVYAAWSMELLYFPEHTERLYIINDILDLKGMETFIVQRAKQVIQDPVNAEFPDPNKLDVSRAQVIRDDIAKLTSLEIGAYYEKLSLLERLAWSKIIEGYGEKLPKGVAGMSKLILKVNWTYAPEIDLKLQQKITDYLKNKTLTREVVDGFVDLLTKNADNYADCLFTMRSAGKAGQGITFHVTGGEGAQQWKSSIFQVDHTKLLSGEVSAVIGVGGYIDRDWVTAMQNIPSETGRDQVEEVNKLIDSILDKLESGENFMGLFFIETTESAKKYAEDENS